jgi:MoaA/NifB/PqqE/SkfB family radical SAM enzyme
MTNLVVSNVCNMHCPYCFSKDFLQGAESDDAFISQAEFAKRLDFLETSGMDEVRFIGGEPSLHPRFADLLRQAGERFAKIVVFSHGILNDAALAALTELPAERLTVMVNMATSEINGSLNDAKTALRQRALTQLQGRCLVAYTISGPDFNADALLPIILEHHCRKEIRLGLAQPMLSGQNVFLHPKQYPFVGRRIVQFALRAASLGVRVEFDCGFVRCMFSQKDFDTLRSTGAYVELCCSPILDIDITGKVSSCFPLAGRFVTEFIPTTPRGELLDWFTGQLRPYRNAGIYKECSTCVYKLRDECTGGCLAATLLRFQKASFGVTMPS